MIQSMAQPSHTSNLPLHSQVLLEDPGVCAELYRSQSSLALKVQKEVRICFFCELGKYLDLGHICEAWHYLSKEDLLTVYLCLAT